MSCSFCSAIATILKYYIAFLSLAFVIPGCSSHTSLQNTFAHRSLSWSTSADLWVLNRQRVNGAFPRIFDPSHPEIAPSYVGLEQFVVGHRLAQLARNRISLLPAHLLHLEYIESNMLQTKDSELTISLAGETTLQAQALYLRLLIASPVQYSEKKTRIEQFASLIREAWDPLTGFPEFIGKAGEKGHTSRRLYTTQATLALLEHHSFSGNQDSLKTALKALSWLGDNHPVGGPSCLDPTQAVWLAKAFMSLQSLNPSNNLSPNLLLLGDEVLRLQDTKNSPGSFSCSGSRNYGARNILADAKSTQILIMAAIMAVQTDDKSRQKRYEKAIELGIDNLRSHQYSSSNVSAFREPSSIIGGVRYRYTEPLVNLEGVVESAIAFEEAAYLASKIHF